MKSSETPKAAVKVSCIPELIEDEKIGPFLSVDEPVFPVYPAAALDEHPRWSAMGELPGPGLPPALVGEGDQPLPASAVSSTSLILVPILDYIGLQ